MIIAEMGRLKYTKPEKANWRKKRKMAKNVLERNAQNVAVIVLLGIFAMYVVIPGYDQYFAPEEELEVGVTTTIPEIRFIAEPVYTGQNTIDVITGDKFNPTAGKDVCCIVKVNGVRIGDIATAGTADITANTGDIVKLWCGGDDTSSGDFDCGVNYGQNQTADWWFTPITYIVPNKEQSKLEIAIYPEDNTHPTNIIYRDDGIEVVSTSTASNQTIAAGKTYNLKMRTSATNEKAYGTPKILSGLDYAVVRCAEYNNTIFDDIQIRYFGQSNELPVISPPREFTTASKNTSTCWKLPDDMMDANENYYTLFLDIDDDDTPIGDTVTFVDFDVGTFVDENTGTVEYGIQDERGNDVGQTTEETFQLFYDA